MQSVQDTKFNMKQTVHIPNDIVFEIYSFCTFQVIEETRSINSTWKRVADLYIQRYKQEILRNPTLETIFRLPVSYKFLEWAEKMNLLGSKDVFKYAVKTQPKEILCWMELKQKEVLDESAFAKAASSQPLSVLVYLRKKGGKWDARALEEATKRPPNSVTERVLVWLILNHAPCNEKAIENAKKFQRNYILQLLQDYGSMEAEEKLEKLYEEQCQFLSSNLEYDPSMTDEEWENLQITIALAKSLEKPIQTRMSTVYNARLVTSADYICTVLEEFDAHYRVIEMRREVAKYITKCRETEMHSPMRSLAETQLCNYINRIMNEYNIIVPYHSLDNEAVVNQTLERIKWMERNKVTEKMEEPILDNVMNDEQTAKPRMERRPSFVMDRCVYFDYFSQEPKNVSSMYIQ